MSQTAQHPVQQAINQVLKGGKRVVEVIDGIPVVTVDARITLMQSLEFMEYIRTIATQKGRCYGKMKNGALNVISDWYDTELGTFSIDHIYGKGKTNKTDYFTIQWARDFAMHKPK